MPSYLRFTPPPLEVSSVRPRLTVLVALGCLACGGAGPGKLAPQSPQETLAQFMSAVKANDLERMRTLWGSERGLASSHLKSTDVNQRLAVLQIYLNHVGYRVVEGPLAACSLTQSAPSRCRPSSSDARTRYAGRRRRAAAPRR